MVADRFRHPFSTDNGKFHCYETDKFTSLSVWTNHKRAAEFNQGHLIPNSCEHCHDVGDEPKSVAQRLRELSDERAQP